MRDLTKKIQESPQKINITVTEDETVLDLKMMCEEVGIKFNKNMSRLLEEDYDSIYDRIGSNKFSDCSRLKILAD